jgi:transposase
MGNPAGVRRDFDALEKRRFQAIRLLDDGLNQTDVAHRLSVSRSTVVRWVGQYRHEGREALRKAGRAGRKPRLDAVQSKRLEERLRQGPERLGYETPLWTCPRVADLIEREFGIRYHPGHVWKVLVNLGWSPQRPTGKARERNEELIQTWRKKIWPGIKKKPARMGARSSSSTKVG